MSTIKVFVGSVVAGSSGQTNDSRREVRFEGEELARRTEYGAGREGGITDTRGVAETLYKTADGRLIIYVEDWSRWQGEPDVYRLVEVAEADLDVGGHFEDLGRKAGMCRPLTLDDVLEQEGEAA